MSGEWNEWSKHVLTELKRLEKSSQDISRQLNRIEVEIATLKVKSGFFGAVGAFIAMVVYEILRKG